MKLETITGNILTYFSTNFGTYIAAEGATIPTPTKYLEGDVDVLLGNDVNFILCVDEILFNELENSADLLDIGCTIFIIFKLKMKQSDANKIVKQYANALYSLICNANSIGNAVDYSKINKIEFYEVTETTQNNTKIMACDIRFYKEI
jgi:hypothetical protein